MGGPLSVVAEVAGGTDDASPEVVMPDPVDDHAGGQGVRGIDEPFGQGQASLRLRAARRPGELAVITGELGQRAGGDLLQSLHHVPALKDVDLVRLGEKAGVDLAAAGQRLQLLREFLALRGDGVEPLTLVFRQGFAELAHRQPAAGGGPALVGGDGLPGLAVQRDFQPVFGGQTVAIAGFGAGVSSPDDPVDIHRPRQFDLRPALAPLVADPAPGIAVSAVVQVGNLVDGETGEQRRGRCLAADRSQGYILVAARTEDLQFIQAWLGAVVGGQNGEAQESRLHGLEALFILLGANGRPAAPARG